MAPTSQKASERPISFLLTGGQGSDTSVPLVLRPEDLTRSEPSRASVQQTLGSAWVDNFGPGLSTINISGHTGWGSGGLPDGGAKFFQLRDTIFTQWHARRAAAVAGGKDPAEVKLIYADTLDDISVSVVPMQFVLKRNRARPLLMMYQISMIVLGDDVAPDSTEADGPPDAESEFGAGVDSLSDSLGTLQDAAANVSNIFQSDIIGPIEGIMGVANTAMSRVLGAVNGVDGLIYGQTAQIVGFARDITQTARNAMYTYNAIVSQPDVLRAAVMDIAGAFDNAFCVLSNVFGESDLYPDYSDIYGSSNCSSTSGGLPLSPLRGENGFYTIVPQYQPSIAVTPLAQSNISLLRAADPVLAPIGYGDLSSRLSNITAGVTFL